MKKVALHIFFWLLYWCITIYLDFFWLKETVPGLTNVQVLLRVSAGAFIYIMPLIVLAYYLVHTLEQLVLQKPPVWQRVLRIVLPFVAAVMVVFILMRKLVFGYIYHLPALAANNTIDIRRFLNITVEAAFPAGLLMAVKFVQHLLQSKERESRLLQEKLNAELQLLKGQINPHFLFNTLNNIYALARKKSSLTADAVMKLSDLMSYMLYEAGHDLVSIDKEVIFLKDYLAIQQLRYTNALIISFDTFIDDACTLITPMLLLPLVENAFKHGASENCYDSFIHIKLKLEKSLLCFEIVNSYEAADTVTRSNSIGLNNIRRRLDLLYAEYNIDMNKTNQFFQVKLQVNLNSYAKN